MVFTLFSKKLRLRNFFTIFSFFKLWNKAIENIFFYLGLILTLYELSDVLQLEKKKFLHSVLNRGHELFVFNPPVVTL